MNIQKTTNSRTIYIIHTDWASVFSIVYTQHTHPLYPDIANYCAFAQYTTEKWTMKEIPQTVTTRYKLHFD